MGKFYFQWMHEGGGTAGCGATVVTAKDEIEACGRFVERVQHDFYGASPTFKDYEEAFKWIYEQVKTGHRTVHGCFQVPSQIAENYDDGEIWELYQESDVRSFFAAPPGVPLERVAKIQMRKPKGPALVQANPGFGYIVRDQAQEQFRKATQGMVMLTPEAAREMERERALIDAGFTQDPMEPVDPKPAPAPTGKPKTDDKTYYKRKLGL